MEATEKISLITDEFIQFIPALGRLCVVRSKSFIPESFLKGKRSLSNDLNSI